MKQRWTATTVAEALDILKAARGQLDSRMLALAPGADYREKDRLEKETPLFLAIDLDLTVLEQATAAKHQFNEIVRSDTTPEVG
ncbi:hypothetical protein GA0115253_1004539 [Streptomyces sp. Termitarium-T10T-6]|nr:hypothetical protein [Streptomyces sp. Termitarium-T10T-6]SCD43378.1 hypothetical protein GA0115253_1004539 [Streptomyces sp. Termitarium-T10T-6]